MILGTAPFDCCNLIDRVPPRMRSAEQLTGTADCSIMIPSRLADNSECAGLVVPISSRGNFVGRWVRARSNDLGYAYCVSSRYDEAVLEYTDIAGLASHTAVIAISDLQTPRISRGTRVWLRG